MVKMVIISPAEDVSAVGGGAFTARDFAVYGTFVIEFTPYGAVRPTYTLRSVHLGGKDANLDWVFALCFCILALLEIVFVVQLVVCAVLQRRGAHAAFADHDKTFQAMKTMRRNLLEKKFTRRLNEASTKMTLKELEALAETVQQEELEDLNDEMEKLQHHSEDVDEDGLDDEHARKNKSLSNWIPTIIADVVLALLLLNVLIAGARNDVVVKALELPDPNQDDEAAAYAFGAQLASYDVTWNYFTWCLTAAAFWGWLSQIAHLTVFFPAFGVPCNTLVKRGGDMIIACIMIAILVSICTTFYNLLSQRQFSHLFVLSFVFKVCAIMCGFLLVLGNFDYSFNDPRALLLYSVRAVMGDFEFDVFEGTQWRHHAPIFIACYSIVIVYVLMSIFGAFIVLLCCAPRCSSPS